MCPLLFIVFYKRNPVQNILTYAGQTKNIFRNLYGQIKDFVNENPKSHHKVSARKEVLIRLPELTSNTNEYYSKIQVIQIIFTGVTYPHTLQ